MSDGRFKIVIVGGGISGLSTAYYLQKMVTQNKLSACIDILEQSDKLGGKMQTEMIENEQGRFVVEAGPDAMLSTKPMAKQLAEELGVFNESIGTNTQKNTLYIWQKGKLHAVPRGMYLIVPTNRWEILKSSLFSWKAKWRLLREAAVPPRETNEDESLYDFIHRRFGKEVANVLGIPLMAGIYNANPKCQSMNTTFGTFVQMEKKYGSLTRGLKTHTISHRKGSPFFSFTSGVYKLIDTLIDALQPVKIHTNCKVDRIINEDQRYKIQTDQGEEVADIVVLTTAAAVSSQLVSHVDTKLAGLLAKQKTVSTGTITLAYPTQNIQKSLDGFGILFPSSEKRTFNAITVSSVKFTGRAPEGYELIRLFFGGYQKQYQVDFSNELLLEAAKKELQEVLCIQGDPIFYKIYRWYNAAPQYEVGHETWLKDIEQVTPECIYFTGSAYRGIGIPDCVNQAKLTAKEIIEDMLLRQIDIKD